jgi:hypothetical protein
MESLAKRIVGRARRGPTEEVEGKIETADDLMRDALDGGD